MDNQAYESFFDNAKFESSLKKFTNDLENMIKEGGELEELRNKLKPFGDENDNKWKYITHRWDNLYY